MTDHNTPTDGQEPVDAIEFSAEERRALYGLSREREPGRMLEERTVRALREDGLLESSTGSGGNFIPSSSTWRRSCPVPATQTSNLYRTTGYS